MAYTDSLRIRYFAATDVTATGVIFDMETGQNAVRCPTGESLETFGLLCVVGGVTTVQAAIYTLFIGKSIADANPSSVASISIPVGTSVTGTRVESGAIAARGTRVLPGQYLQIQLTQAATGVGTFEPYVVLRIDGYTAGKPGANLNPNSPLTIVFS